MKDTQPPGNQIADLTPRKVKPVANVLTWIKHWIVLKLKFLTPRTRAELERKHAEAAMRQRTQQDTLVSDISRAFLNQDTESAIAYTLCRIASLTGSDHCYIHKYDRALQEWSTTHEWHAEGITPLKPSFQSVPIDQFAWAWHQVLKGQVVQVASIDDLPPVAAAEKAILEQLGIQACLTDKSIGR
ncbi:MAG TPA: hypothetical protein V6C84_05905 [Coleofasciculaceae cyanobacterium]|jgi:hypothetical protein